jgi:tRNA uridine 5-carboxymethylaminomethyl modification enzyme
LITKGADEPYRMFTSRAEFRLHLRIDNADERLTPIAERIGLASAERVAQLRTKLEQKERLVGLLGRTRVTPEAFGQLGLAHDERPPLSTWLRRPEARLEQIGTWLESELGEPLASGLATTVETEIKYEGYMKQQDAQIRRLREAESRRIPEDFRFREMPGLSREIWEKLERVRPETIGQASRIPGVTPAAIAILDVQLTLRQQQ